MVITKANGAYSPAYARVFWGGGHIDRCVRFQANSSDVKYVIFGTCIVSITVYVFIRKQRLAQIKQYQQAARFGEMMEITAVDYVQEVNKAGEGIWVVLYLYKTG